jgi:pimeloyl-ACP methyl ester carboxylesterase
VTTQDVTITAGDVTLAGTYTTPDSAGPHPGALVLAGSGPLDRDGNARRIRLNLSRDLARTLDANGWASLRFDKRGVGSSTGDYLQAGFYDELADAEAALKWLASRPDVSSVVVIGHSIGATMATELAVRNEAVDGVVLLSVTAQTGENTLTWQAAQIAPTLPAPARALLRLMRTDVLRQQRKALDRIMRTKGDVERIQGAKVNARWMREFIAYDPGPTLRRIRVPVLAMTGSKDVQVDPADVHVVAEVVAGAQAQVIDDVDHILRHEPRDVSNVRRYRKQAAQPIDAEVERRLVEWLQHHTSGLPEVRP